MTYGLRYFGILAVLLGLSWLQRAAADEAPSEPTPAAEAKVDQKAKAKKHAEEKADKKADKKGDEAAEDEADEADADADEQASDDATSDATSKEAPSKKDGKAKAETPTPAKKKAEPAAKAEPDAKAEADKKSEPKKAPKPPTYTVAREPLKVELSLKGMFEAETATPVSLRPKQWRELTVVEAVANGSEVRKGDVLVQLDLEKIDDQIADLRRDQTLSELLLKQAEETLQILQESTPLELQHAELTKQHSDEDLEQFVKVERPLYQKIADFMLKMNQQRLDYQQEELAQLEKMYKADDLTEQTEEIVLKRQRNEVEQAKFFLELAKVRHEEELKYQLPRADESQQYSHRQQEFLYRRAKLSLPVLLKQQQADLEKRKIERQRAQKRLDELVADREAMTIKAPADGTVYYGQYQRGQWTGATSVADELRSGGTLPRDKVFMTVVQLRPLTVRVDVPEENLHYIRPGLKATLVPTGYPDQKLSATVDAVDKLPLGSQYAATLTVTLPHEADVLVPGMTCAVKVVPYLKKRALVVPAAAVFPDKLDDEKKYVYLYREGEKPEKQAVTVGKRAGDRLEIVEGLDRGDEILLEEPKDLKQSKPKDE